MEVRPAFPGPVEPEGGLTAAASGRASPSVNPALVDSPGLASPPAQADTVLLGQISASDLERILAAALPEPSPAVAAQADASFRNAVAAIGRDDVAGAMTFLRQAVLLDPRRAETVSSDPQLGPVSTQIEQLLAKLVYAARLDAEVLASRASDVLHASAAHHGEEWAKDVTQLRGVAVQLLETNTYINFLRSAHISQVVIDSGNQFNPALNVFVPPVSEPDRSALGSGHDSKLRTPETARFGSAPARFRSRVIVLWRRAPLAVLLLAWLALGFGGLVLFALAGTSRSAFTVVGEIWTIGFLALVGLGFYARVRNIRFGP